MQQHIKRVLFLGSWICCHVISAQIPNSILQPLPPTASAPAAPAAYSAGVFVNYVRTRQAIAPINDENNFAGAGYSQVSQATQYLDGFGRPIQTVIKDAYYNGTNTQDLVSPVVYDEFGREPIKYLPYLSSDNNGSFKRDPFTEQNSFNRGFFAAGCSSGDGEDVFYSKTLFENSPLNRPLKTMAAGNSWAGHAKGVEISYEINEDAEVRMWQIDDLTNKPVSPDYYPRERLYRTVTTDEHGKKVIEYKDKEGKVILKKVQLSGTPSYGVGGVDFHTGWLCTYYVYDDFGLLRCVLPPKAVEVMSKNNWEIDATACHNVFEELCFQYTYDYRHRMITKKVPGAAIVYMVYDTRDRLILTQDGNLRRDNNKWLVTTYDPLNRPAKTYLAVNTNASLTHADFQAAAQNITNYPVFGQNGWTNDGLLTETYYDNYSWTSTAGVPSGFNDNHFISGYYITPDNTIPPYAQPYNPIDAPLGMVTGTKTRVLGTTDFTYSVSFYDDKNRVIQVYNTLYPKGNSLTTNEYDFAGKVLRSLSTIAEITADPTGINTLYTYDDFGKLITLQKSVNNQPLKTITQNTYNALGQLQTKALGNDMTTNDPVETLDYTYNIRGWLTGINRGFANPLYTAEYTAQQERWFGMQLNYDYGFEKSGTSTGMLNGNISGQIWKSKSNGKQRSYGYEYDAANRLMKADFNSYDASGSVWDKTDGYDFTVTMGDGTGDPTKAYDGNGNILAMKQMGYVSGSSTMVDDLEYTYMPNSNKLLNVTDAGMWQQPSGASYPRLGDFRYSATVASKPNGDLDYQYDDNGNLIFDDHKDIASITYNHLNLPHIITITGKGTIEYRYDATGNKLTKIVTDNTQSPAKKTITYYMAGMVYEQTQLGTTVGDMKLQFINHEEGRFRAATNQSASQPTRYVSDYFIKDHLGNVRMTLTEETTVSSVVRASLEDALLPVEQQIFDQLFPRPKNQEFDADAANQKVQVLPPVRSENPSTGMGLLLKVTAGDKIKASVFAHYNDDPENNTGNPNTDNIIAQIMNGINEGYAILTGKSGEELLTTSNSNGITNFVTSKYNELPNEDGILAHLNWLLLEEADGLQFNSESSGFEPVPYIDANEGKVFLQAEEGEEIEITRNGYLYIFVSNNSMNKPVKFDDLIVRKRQSALLEETHYYPFGLSMSGINSKTAGSLENKKKFVGQELNNDFDVNWYEFAFRSHDPQIGRFIQIDPLADKYVYNSTYAYAENRVINSYDLEGLEAKLAIAGVGHGSTHYSSSDVNAFNDRAQRLQKIGFEASQAQNGDQIVNQLKQATASEGSIGSVVIFAHSGGNGIFLDNNEGLYTGTTAQGAPGSAADVSDIKKAVDAGEIKFDKDATFVFGSCSTCSNVSASKGQDPFAVSMAKELQVTTYGATGSVYPEKVNGNETGRLKTDGTFMMNTPTVTTSTSDVKVPIILPNIFGGGLISTPFTKTVPVTTTTVTVKQTNVGNTIDPQKIFPKN